ncbi:hypothetical protein MKJ04_22205 [Pontibacter sp. E15-1]|uniref:hypothetical protein n=1 Tax=Pontibacter sp. E15-1 TaxID=2919918 RepID=UPI001F4FDAE9|nr:hypothetical protein [Pontibacter sp. E15-1]MCJ8167572.1 hypothetical protein [Pontibacter sp. E15-1]
MINIYRTLTLALVSVALLSAFGCQKEEAQAPGATLLPCDANRETVQTANALEGFVWFNTTIQEYAIYVGVGGTYDTQYVCVPCKLPEELKQEGVQVVFSGKLKDFGQQPAMMMPGQTYYYLHLSNIEAQD